MKLQDRVYRKDPTKLGTVVATSTEGHDAFEDDTVDVIWDETGKRETIPVEELDRVALGVASETGTCPHDGQPLSTHIGGKPCVQGATRAVKAVQDLPVAGWAWRGDSAPEALADALAKLDAVGGFQRLSYQEQAAEISKSLPETTSAQDHTAGIRAAVEHLEAAQQWEAAETVAEMIGGAYLDEVRARYEATAGPMAVHDDPVTAALTAAIERTPGVKVAKPADLKAYAFVDGKRPGLTFAPADTARQCRYAVAAPSRAAALRALTTAGLKVTDGFLRSYASTGHVAGAYADLADSPEVVFYQGLDERGVAWRPVQS